MLLAIDVGNTQTVFGLYDGDRLTEHWRIFTDVQRTGDELGVFLRGFLDTDSLDGICLSTTVPLLLRSYEELSERLGVELLAVGPGARTGIAVRYDDPREVGPDRIVNAVAARERYGAPCIVVDFGTSTNFDVVSPEGPYELLGRRLRQDFLIARSGSIDQSTVLGHHPFKQPHLWKDCLQIAYFPAGDQNQLSARRQ